jgi:uncharacterized protein (TIRG00374 family)
MASTPTDLLRDTRLWFRAVTVQVVEIGLDAATLHVMLLALGVRVPLTATFASYVMASAVARVVPVPLGLGSFEAAMVGMLRAVGVPLEAGLAATLLLRGLTMWLPMLPGLWFARRELRAGPAGLDDDAPSSGVSSRALRATSRRRP